MVKKANKTTNVGGHIATFASAATLYEVGFNHFFKGRNDKQPGDVVFYQGHASPGPYARAFLEGRLNEQQLKNFRQELQPGGGLSSYPHPWLMPDFWQFPTVSMGLGPIMSIYHARFNRYLRDRGLAKTDDVRVWRSSATASVTSRRASAASPSRRGAARQPDLGHQLQLATPRRPRPRQRQNHPGTRRPVPRSGWNVIKVLWGSGWKLRRWRTTIRVP